MTETVTAPTGWSSLGTLLQGISYAGRNLVTSLTIKNRTGSILTVRRHSSASTAPGSDSGIHLDDGESYTIGDSGVSRGFDLRMIWVNNAGASGSVDVDGTEVG